MPAGCATRWYTNREKVKAAVGLAGGDLNALIDAYIQAGSEDVEAFLSPKRFIPETATKYFPWPTVRGGKLFSGYAGYVLYFVDVDLIAATLVQSRAQDAVPVVIPAANYFLEPANLGPPYTRIEINLASTSAFDSSGSTPQRSIAIAGRWGMREDTKSAGALAAAIATAGAVTCTVTDSSLIGVGDTLLIDAESIFVSEKALLDTTATLNGGLAASLNTTAVPIDTGTKIKPGEVIQVDSERMFVDSVAANTLTVKRAYDGTVLAAHLTATPLYAYRTLTIVRGVNGTTAATHLISALISRYSPPADIEEYVRAYAIAHHEQGRSGWTGQIGGTEGGAVGTTKNFGVWAMRQALIEKYGKVTS